MNNIYLYSILFTILAIIEIFVIVIFFVTIEDDFEEKTFFGKASTIICYIEVIVGLIVLLYAGIFCITKEAICNKTHGENSLCEVNNE